jgi:phage shock protein PspC (stress-responsive transcriptional regulator)
MPTDLSGSTSLHQIREGYVLDYDLQTWTVAEHTKYPYEGWPSDVWTLEQNGEERQLEYDHEEGGTFRLYEHVPVDAESFAGDGRRGEPPDRIEYEGTQYVLTERDVRVHEEGQVREGEEDYISFLARSVVDRKLLGACGGLARHLRLPSWLVRVVVSVVVFFLMFYTVLIVGLLTGGNLLFEYWKITGVAILGMIWGYYHLFALLVPEPPPKVLSHYWVYESDEDDLLTLRCEEGEWTMRVGREVEPYEFDNILPAEEG